MYTADLRTLSWALYRLHVIKILLRTMKHVGKYFKIGDKKMLIRLHWYTGLSTHVVFVYKKIIFYKYKMSLVT